MTRDPGFSIVELIVAMGLMLAVAAAAFALLDPAGGVFAAVPEVSDLQQRLRVTADTLSTNLMMAGAGPRSGPHAGSLQTLFAPVLPYRVGAVGQSPPGSYTTDVVSIFSVPYAAGQTTTSVPIVAAAAGVRVNDSGACPRDPGGTPTPVCGFVPGTNVLIVDAAGRHDVFTVAAVDGDVAQLAVHKPPGDADTMYPAGSTIVEVVERTFALRADAVRNVYQLVSYDGSDHAEVPVVDDVVALEFEYFGDPQPPVLITPSDDETAPWTSYGPRPPPPDVKTTEYAAGENCLFARDSHAHAVPRLPVLDTTASLVKLTAQQLTDGPWCPDSISTDRYDADLLRIRAIGVTIRLQSALESLRGPAGTLFLHPGTAKDGRRWVPDREVRFMVVPRNLNSGR